MSFKGVLTVAVAADRGCAGLRHSRFANSERLRAMVALT